MTADTLARARARAAFMARPGLDQMLTIHSSAVGQLADVAAAAVALVGRVSRMPLDEWPWWRDTHESGMDCIGCWQDVGHADDCPAMALECAIRRLAGEVAP